MEIKEIKILKSPKNLIPKTQFLISQSIPFINSPKTHPIHHHFANSDPYSVTLPSSHHKTHFHHYHPILLGHPFCNQNYPRSLRVSLFLLLSFRHHLPQPRCLRFYLHPQLQGFGFTFFSSCQVCPA